MASHGVPRHTTAPKSEKARQKEQREIHEYKDLVDQVTELISSKAFSQETLDLTSKLLTKNPEYYTIWNHRRRVLNHLLARETYAPKDDQTADDAEYSKHVQQLIATDLDFLFPLLVKFPKCYWIWNHRRWLLEQATARLQKQQAHSFWKHELALVAKMLASDSRNFHGWGYRRTVIAALRNFEEPPPSLKQQQPQDAEQDENREQQKHPQQPHPESITEQEFAYTTKMVRGDLSNFSAWHNRSKLLPRLLDERRAGPAARRALFDAELALVSDALSMDPHDQSLWFYHQFLVGSLVQAPSSNPAATATATTATAATKGSSCFGIHNAAASRGVLAAQIALFREVLEDDDDACRLLYINLLGLAELWAATLPESESGGSPGDGAQGQAKQERQGEHEHGGEQENNGEASSTSPPPVSDAEMRAWLGRLRELDPLRAGRWDDLERRMGLL